jgi:flagellar biosynthesis/type III secretory pathway chaperone
VTTTLEHKPRTRQEICKRAGQVSAAKRRARWQEIHELTRQLQATNPALASWKAEQLELVIYHAGELGRLLSPIVERSDIFAMMLGVVEQPSEGSTHAANT